MARRKRIKPSRIPQKIRTLVREGYPQRQAVAIAHRMAGKSRRRRSRR